MSALLYERVHNEAINFNHATLKGIILDVDEFGLTSGIDEVRKRGLAIEFQWIELQRPDLSKIENRDAGVFSKRKGSFKQRRPFFCLDRLLH
jgi:hypothetical protein